MLTLLTRIIGNVTGGASRAVTKDLRTDLQEARKSDQWTVFPSFRQVDGDIHRPEPRHNARMTTPDLPDWAEPLGLAPHPEGGWFVETYRAATTVDVLTESGTTSTRPTATLIQFLLLPGEQSAWHRVTSDEVWILLRGGRLALDLGGDGETPGNVERIVLGPDTTREVLQGTVPAGVWQRAEPLDDEPVLVSCMVTPGFVFDDFTLLDEDAG